jgi:hypothetical protein
MSIINRHLTLASEPHGMTGVYGTSCHWATLRRVHIPGTMGSQVPAFTTEPEGMRTVGPDVAVDPDPQPETKTPTSRAPAVQAPPRIRRPFRRDAAGSFNWGSV